MKKVFTIVLLAVSLISSAQKANNPLQPFENLTKGKWVSKGKWKNGNDYQQEVAFEWELSKKIVIARTYDFIDSKQFDDSLRNYGIRAWDEQKHELVFLDANVFGGVVQGKVTCTGNDIYYSYDYMVNGEHQVLTDAWLFRDHNTYDFKVGIYKDGIWQKEFLTGTFHRK